MAPFTREQNSTNPTGVVWDGPGLPQEGVDNPPPAHFTIDPATGAARVTLVGGGGGPATNLTVDNFPTDYATEPTLQETNARLGDEAEAAAPTDTSNSGLNGLIKRLLQRLTVFISLFPVSIGQKTSAGSLATVLASDQPAIPTTATVANFPATQPVSGSVTVSNLLNPHPISATVLPLPTGAATDTNLTAVIGATNESAAGTDTATSGLNGLVKRLLQRFTTLLSVLPAALGQTTMAGSLPVVIASNQSALTTNATVTGTVTANAGTNLNTSLLALETTQLTTNTNIGATNEAAAGTDTATSGLNGLFKRLLQKFTTQFPATLGQKTSANSFAVVLPSDQTISATITSGSFNETIPATADLVGNSLSATGTLYDIPAGRTFRGSFSIAASISVLGTGNPTISIAALSGGTVFPAAGTKLQVVLSGLALVAVATSNTINDVYINGGSNGVRVTFTQAATGLSSGQISGRLL